MECARAPANRLAPTRRFVWLQLVSQRLFVPPHFQRKGSVRRHDLVDHGSDATPAAFLVEPCRSFVSNRAREPRCRHSPSSKPSFRICGQHGGHPGSARLRRNKQLIEFIPFDNGESFRRAGWTDDPDFRKLRLQSASEVFQRAKPGEFRGHNRGVRLVPALEPEAGQMIEFPFVSIPDMYRPVCHILCCGRLPLRFCHSMTHRLHLFGIAGVLVSVVVLNAQQPSTPFRTATVENVPSPAGPNSAQPQLSSSKRGVLLSWIERAGEMATLRFAERTSSGWSGPRTVAAGDNWFVNWADVPSVLRLDNGTIVAHWLQKSGSGTYAYDVRLSYSRDEGKTWSTSFTPHSDGTKTEHGFASLFQMAGAGLGVVWLDGRAMKAESGHAGHAATGAMSLRFAAYGTDWKKLSDTPVDLRVCECCPTTAVVTEEGPIAAFRNRTDDEVRDIFVSRLDHGKWTEPHAVHRDEWRINACPVNGPMLSARGRTVAIAWFTAQGDQGRALLAFSRDAGRTFSTPIRLDEAGALGRVDVELLPDGSAIGSWIELADERAQFRVRRVDASGAKSPSITISALANSRASGYPRIAVHGDEVVFAWTETSDGRSEVKTAVARLNQLRR